MALGVTVILALTCLGGLTAPVPGPSPMVILKDFIEELVNITQDQKTPLCNGTMVWSVNLTAGMWYCAAHESLSNVSSCSALQRTQKTLSSLCQRKALAGAPSLHSQDTKIEVAQFVKRLLKHLKSLYRNGKFN
ncbi:interleukin-13 [Octodon degus]|uniref:Interleukin-13 n=1 Tax=Octodon degus TaxID=10160 RepID=A0A6P3F4M5_OCTDE|nr:interleukin-13 [Octodon degus]